MNILNHDIELKRLWFTKSDICIETIEGKVLSHPLSWFPQLQNASIEERENYTLTPFGIHWPDIDEDLSFEGFFGYRK